MRVGPTNAFIEFRKEDSVQSIPDRFEKIVRQLPGHLALRMADRALTYAHLNQTANRIAHAILDKRGSDSEPIALLLELGIDVITSIFGVLKAGKFYVALDSSLPMERTHYILEDTQAGLVLTNGQNLQRARAIAGTHRQILDIDEIDDSVSSTDLGIGIPPDSLANIRYTSGSTGEPKGIVQGHLQVLEFASLGAVDRGIEPEDRLTLLQHPGFGAANTHLFQSLLNGASLFPFDIKSAGIQRLAKYLIEERITICSLSPSLFRQLAPLLQGQERPTDLRLVTLVGAPVTLPDFELYQRQLGNGTRLEIFLGSTEAGAICSAFIDQSFSFPQEGSPVGYPCRGKKVILIDENGEAVGADQIGEIAVMGESLNLGYWRRPELTAEKFVRYSLTENERLCLTGDLGIKRPDGFLIYLGRKDSQVKIRGYRVEPGEIETALLTHPAVADAAVVARDKEPGEKCLVAYVVPVENADVTIGELRGFLASKLPDYMIPSVFIFLDSLPLVNGKPDRNALPDPKERPPELRTTYVPPRSEVERKLVETWQEILGGRPIGIHDNFLDLGGHSLIATRIISKINEAFGIEISIRNMLDAPTVAGLAGIVESLLESRKETEPNCSASGTEEETGEI